jgi:hypothetical protein
VARLNKKERARGSAKSRDTMMMTADEIQDAKTRSKI